LVRPPQHRRRDRQSQRLRCLEVDDQDADTVFLLYRASTYKNDVPTEEKDHAEVIIGKQRNGPTGVVPVVFLPQYARFENMASDARRDAAAA